MSLGGLWHGADIAFLLWGTFLGTLLGLERIFDKANLSLPEIPGKKMIKWIYFIFLLILSGIFFRSGMFGEDSLNVIGRLFKGIFSFREGKLIYRHEELLGYILIGMILNYLEYYNVVRINQKLIKEIFLPIYAFLLMILLGIFGDGGGDFIYFQF
jgi:D-alanyl-lipoteichoic acid acyltransferase DltB (MBOAT superfamily)